MVDIIPSSQLVIGHGAFSIVYRARLKAVSRSCLINAFFLKGYFSKLSSLKRAPANTTCSKGQQESLQLSKGQQESLQLSKGQQESIQLSKGEQESLQLSKGQQESLQFSKVH